MTVIFFGDYYKLVLNLKVLYIHLRLFNQFKFISKYC